MHVLKKTLPKPYINAATAKICGLISAEDVHYAAHAGIAAGIKMQAGFLYGVDGDNPADFKKMENGLHLLKQRVRDAKSKGMEAVIVTDMTYFLEFRELLQHVSPVTLQLCGDMEEKAIAELKKSYGTEVKIIRAIHIGEDEAAATKTALAWDKNPHIDALLLDSCNGGPSKGGTGRKHNWNISARIMAMLTKPCGLAGGLNPDNVADAIEQVRPRWVDVDTGTRKPLADGVTLNCSNYRRDADACIAFTHNAASAFHMTFARDNSFGINRGVRQLRKHTS